MILITGGGTGGHLSIAKALKEAFVERGVRVVYVGSTSGQDRIWFEKDKDFEARYFLDSSGVVNKRGISKLSALANIAKESVKATSIIKKEKIKAVVSVGGYSAAPASFAALLQGIPLFVHEQNAHIGRLNRMLRPFSKRLFCSFLPPFDPYPLSEEFYRRKRIRKELETIIFLGGSQGARQINDLAISLAPGLKKRDIRIIHQCGREDFERVKKAYEKLGIEADLFAFSKEIAKKMSQADLAISRAGASTLWELCANALPALLLPYPYAANDHQRSNALFFHEKGGMQLYEEDMDLFSLPIQRMSETLYNLFEPYGERKIAKEILEAIS